MKTIQQIEEEALKALRISGGINVRYACSKCGKYTGDFICDDCYAKMVKANPQIDEDGYGNDFSSEYDF